MTLYFEIVFFCISNSKDKKMKSLLRRHYGDGYHVKALEAIYFERSDATAVNLAIGSSIAGDDDHNVAWKLVSTSLADTFKSAVSGLEPIGWKTIVESSAQIPAILDVLISKLQQALVSAGNALTALVQTIYASLKSVWDYIASFFNDAPPEAIVESEKESTGFFAGMARYIGTTLFATIAHKIANGLLSLLVYLRDKLYAVVTKMTEFLFGGMEAIFKSTDASTNAKDGVVKMGFYFVTVMGNMSEYVNQPTNYIAERLECVAQEIAKYSAVVARHISEQTNALSLAASWLLEKATVTLEWIASFLPWIAIAVGSIKSVALALFGTLNTLAPLLQTMFSSFFAETSDAYKNIVPQCNLPEIKKQLQALAVSVQVSRENQKAARKAIELVDYANGVIQENKEASVNERWNKKKDAETDMLMAGVMTDLYSDPDGEFNFDVIDKIFKQRTGFDPVQLSYLMREVGEIAAAQVLKSQLEIFEKWKEDDQRFADSSFAKQRDTNDAIGIGIDMDDLSKEETLLFERYKAKSVDELLPLRLEKEQELLKALGALDAYEKQIDVGRSAIEQNVMRQYVKLESAARRAGHELDTQLAVAGGLTTQAYMVIVNGAENRMRASFLLEADKLRREMNLIRIASNQRTVALGLRKAKYIILAALLAIAIPAIVYGMFLYFSHNTTAFVITRETAESVSSGGWWGWGSKTIMEIAGLRNPSPGDAVNVISWWRYFQETSGVGTIFRLPSMVNLLGMVWAAAPAAHAIVLCSWFFWSTTIFTILEARTPNYHSDGSFVIERARQLGGSLRTTVETVIYQMGLMFMVYYSYEWSVTAGALATAGSVVGSLLSFNPVAMLSGLALGAQSMAAQQNDRINKALQTRFSAKDLFISDKVYRKIVPSNLEQEFKPLPLLSLVEMLEIKDLLLAGANVVKVADRVLEGTREEFSLKAIEERKTIKKQKKKEQKKKKLLALKSAKGKEEEDDDDDIVEEIEWDPPTPLMLEN
jgi:hypothetical protein